MDTVEGNFEKGTFPGYSESNPEKLCGDNRIKKKEKIYDARAWGMVWNFSRA